MANVVMSCIKNPIYQQAAIDMVARGWTVYCGTTDVDKGDELAGAGIIPIALDVTCDNSVADATKSIMKPAGELDHIFVTSPVSSFGVLEEHDKASAHHQFEVNLFGAMRLLSAFGPFLRGQNGGGFTIVSAGMLPETLPMAGWHNACEAAIDSIVSTAAAEFKSFNVNIAHLKAGLFAHATIHGDAFGLNASGHAAAYQAHVSASTAYLKSVSQKHQSQQDISKSAIDLVQCSILAKDRPTQPELKCANPQSRMDLRPPLSKQRSLFGAVEALGARQVITP